MQIAVDARYLPLLPTALEVVQVWRHADFRLLVQGPNLLPPDNRAEVAVTDVCRRKEAYKSRM